MKFSFLFFALLLSSVSAFAADTSNATAFAAATASEEEILAYFLDEEVCYTATISGSVSIPIIGAVSVSAGIEVTGCGDTAEEAFDALVDGITTAMKIIR